MSKVETKLFIGCLKKGDIETHLRGSKTWKEDSITGQKDFEEAFYEGHSYLGKFLNANDTTYQVVTTNVNQIKEYLTQYCPDIDLDTVEFYIFPQILYK